MAKSRAAQAAIMAERRTKALRLAVTGHTYDDIAETSRREGWLPAPYNSRQSVHKDIVKGYEARTKERNEAAGVYLDMLLEELAQLKKAVWKVLRAKHYMVNQGVIVYMGVSADEGTRRGWNSVDALRQDLIKNADGSFKEPLEDDKPVLDAVDRLLAIQKQEALLTGAYAPVKKQLEVGGALTVDHEINTLLEVVAAGGKGTLTPPAAAGKRAPVVQHSGRTGLVHRPANGSNPGA